jgi:hypothetical protein
MEHYLWQVELKRRIGKEAHFLAVIVREFSRFLLTQSSSVPIPF